jgi:hypothetical protein
MILNFFSTVYTIKRAAWMTDSYGNLYSGETTRGLFKGHIQQATAEVAQSLGLTYTKTFALWCPVGTAVLDGDTNSDGTNRYAAKAVMNHNDGVNKHRTEIGARVFIGSDTMLVAPVKVGDGAMTATGSGAWTPRRSPSRSCASTPASGSSRNWRRRSMATRSRTRSKGLVEARSSMRSRST